MKNKLAVIILMSIVFSCNKIQENISPLGNDIYALTYNESKYSLYKNGQYTNNFINGNTVNKFQIKAMKIKGKDFYFFGNAYENGKNLLKYYKNGQEKILNDGYDFGSNMPVEIALTKNQVITASNKTFVIGNNQQWHASYRVNDQLINLTDDINGAVISDMAVNEQDTYIVGVAFQHKLKYKQNATLWKNGLPIVFSGKMQNPNSIAIDGEEIHIVGTSVPLQNTSKYEMLSYWNNNIEIDLTDGTTIVKNPKIDVKNKDVLITWHETYYIGSTPNYRLMQWANGKISKISDQSIYLSANHCKIDNNQIVAGYTLSPEFQAAYWKDGEIIKLGPSSTQYQYVVDLEIVEK
jgi:hypothetical protein